MKKCCCSCLCLLFCCKSPTTISNNTTCDSLLKYDDSDKTDKHSQSLHLYGNLCEAQTITKFNFLPLTKVKKITCGDNHCLILFNDNKLASLGSNSNGQLGIEINSSTQYFPSLITNELNIPQLKRYVIWDIAAGNDFSLILIGVNLRSIIIRFGLLTADSNDLMITDNALSAVNILDGIIETIPNVSSIYAVEDKVMLLTGSNKVFIGGSDFDDNKLNDFQLLKHFSEVDIQCVALGKSHCLLLDNDGSLYGAGKNDHGELGPKISVNHNEFRLILDNSFDSSIKQITAGEKHSLILLTNGELYALGDNTLGQCSYTSMNYTMPYKINLQSKEDIVDIYSGYNHNLCVLANGEIYTWGDGSNGKLGYDLIDHTKQIELRNLLHISNELITNVYLGKNTTIISMIDTKNIINN